MPNADVFALQHSDLNGFLFADIGVERSGMPLSVISALARLGMDPWQEAARLARLPRPVAAKGLAEAISTMPASLWSLAEAALIAARLVALLPQRDGIHITATAAAVAAKAGPNTTWLLVGAVAVLLSGLAAMLSTTPRPTVPPAQTMTAPAPPTRG